jgi:hypothetical protein
MFNRFFRTTIAHYAGKGAKAMRSMKKTLFSALIVTLLCLNILPASGMRAASPSKPMAQLAAPATARLVLFEGFLRYG